LVEYADHCDNVSSLSVALMGHCVHLI